MAGQTISDEQKKLNKKLHDSRKDFGNRADGAGVAGRLPEALIRMKEYGVCNSFLDYGTGKGKLVKHLRNKLNSDILIDGYDPAVDEWDKKPKQAYDIVSCLDVLEHVELLSVDAVVDEITELTNNFCYIVIDIQPAVKTLDDGRNAHILLAPPDWWVQKFSARFSSVASFPIYHKSGFKQKIVIAGTNKINITSIMYGFLQKMRVMNFVMSGGVLSMNQKK